jgi:hypothetical protein
MKKYVIKNFIGKVIILYGYQKTHNFEIEFENINSLSNEMYLKVIPNKLVILTIFNKTASFLITFIGAFFHFG